MRWPFGYPRISEDEPIGAYVFRIASRFDRQMEARRAYRFGRHDLGLEDIPAAIYAFNQCDLCEVIDYSALE